MANASFEGFEKVWDGTTNYVPKAEVTSRKNYEVQYRNSKYGEWITAGGTQTWQAGMLKSEKLSQNPFVIEIRMFHTNAQFPDRDGRVIEHWRKVE